MPSWAKVLGHGSIRGQKTLRMPRGLPPLHAIRTLPRGTMRVFAPVIEGATLARLPWLMISPGKRWCL